MALSCTPNESYPNEAVWEQREAEQRERLDSPNVVALRLGESFAHLHHTFALTAGSDSEIARRFEESTAREIRSLATKLEIEVSPEELSELYEPRLEEVIQRIQHRKGNFTANIFAFSYYANSASWVASVLSRGLEKGKFLAEESFSFQLEFYLREALRAARSLPLPEKNMRELVLLNSERRSE